MIKVLQELIDRNATVINRKGTHPGEQFIHSGHMLSHLIGKRRHNLAGEADLGESLHHSAALTVIGGVLLGIREILLHELVVLLALGDDRHHTVLHIGKLFGRHAGSSDIAVRGIAFCNLFRAFRLIEAISDVIDCQLTGLQLITDLEQVVHHEGEASEHRHEFLRIGLNLLRDFDFFFTGQQLMRTDTAQIGAEGITGKTCALLRRQHFSGIVFIDVVTAVRGHGGENDVIAVRGLLEHLNTQNGNLLGNIRNLLFSRHSALRQQIVDVLNGNPASLAAKLHERLVPLRHFLRRGFPGALLGASLNFLEIDVLVRQVLCGGVVISLHQAFRIKDSILGVRIIVRDFSNGLLRTAGALGTRRLGSLRGSCLCRCLALLCGLFRGFFGICLGNRLSLCFRDLLNSFCLRLTDVLHRRLLNRLLRRLFHRFFGRLHRGSHSSLYSRFSLRIHNAPSSAPDHHHGRLRRRSSRRKRLRRRGFGGLRLFSFIL